MNGPTDNLQWRERIEERLGDVGSYWTILVGIILIWVAFAI